MSEQETSADVIAAMRNYSNDCNDGYHIDYRVVCTDMRNFADRFEAAIKRERGDCAKLREALENLYDQICHGETEQHVAANRQMIHAALAAPPRNCDVGTVDDQKDRFLEFCDDEKGPREHCRNCRLCNTSDCELAWAQMPYEEGGAKRSKRQPNYTSGSGNSRKTGEAAYIYLANH